jgi:Orsellinic acid/F9775 biosynthesis cluster protein D
VVTYYGIVLRTIELLKIKNLRITSQVRYFTMDPFHYYAEYCVLVCKSCQYAIQPGRLVAHLRSEQHKLTRQQAEKIADQYTDKQLANPSIEHIVPASIISPIEHLPIYRDGLSCNHCQFVCRTRNWILRHQREVHNIRIGKGHRSTQTEWTTTWCQCFFTSIGQRYFQVQQTQQTTEPGSELLQLVHQQLDQKEKVEQDKRQIIKDTAWETEVSSWLDRTQWITHLEGQDKATIVQLVKSVQPEELDL